ncbi:MAG: hypothetical protein KJ018_12845, partial [Burkholderiales bacterium]|nr:hypothetical protein [Burkholderiales bacterium]
MPPDRSSRRLALRLLASAAALRLSGVSRAQAVATQRVPGPLLEGMGRYTLAGAAADAKVQRYVDQGMVLAFGFNPAEAARSFESAIALDAKCLAAW